ncbi:MAG: hypothetical protein GY756_05445 [bacterium]|nr:hypothetical protein [bacterium]
MKKIILLNIIVVSILTGCSYMDYDMISPQSENQYIINGLPVFYIHPEPLSKESYTPVTVIYKGKTYMAEGKIRGAMTATYPKKSYTLKFSDDDLFNDPAKGFENRKKIVLVSNFDDNSYIRNRLAFSLWNKMKNSFKIITFSSEVFTNGEFNGLYTIIDFVDADYIERIGFNREGNLYKGVSHDSNFYIHKELNSGFEKKVGLPEAGNEGAYTDLENFILFINDSDENTFNSDFEFVANDQSYYDWWFFTALLSAGDSMAKNSYHYHDPEGKWHYIPWDFNESFGQAWNTKRRGNGFDPNYNSKNGIFNRLVANPEFSDTYNNRYKLLLQNALNIDEIIDEIDLLYGEVKDSAYKDFSKWEKEYTNIVHWDDREDFTSVDEEVEYIKNWITDQYNLVNNYYN